MTTVREVSVRGLPAWLPSQPLLGPGQWHRAAGELRVEMAQLSLGEAGDLAARLRGLHLDGQTVEVLVSPPLPRNVVREARLEDARRRRDTTPGFLRAGAQVDEEGRYSLTPEALALNLGKEAKGRSVVDLGAGAGGNSIGFARAGCRVVAVEQDAARLAMARHNARCYGVDAQIRFVHGDAVALLPSLKADLLFLDPPWGREYNKERMGLEELPLLKVALGFRSQFGAIWAKVPASFDSRETPDARVEAVFGLAAGDRRRIKFLWLRWEGAAGEDSR
jgi:SAM-dependent methyltransferase